MRFGNNRRMIRRFQWIGVVLAVLAIACVASARTSRTTGVARSASDHATLETRWLDINNFTLPIQNYGQHGNNQAENRSGGEWPSGSGEYYIFGAGIWVAGTVNQGPFTEQIGGQTAYSFSESTTNPLGWRGLGKQDEINLGSRTILTDPRVAVGYEPTGGTEEMSAVTPLYLSTDANWPLSSVVSILDSYCEYDDQDPQRWVTGDDSNSGSDNGAWSGDPTDALIQQYGLGVKVTQTTYTWNYANNSDIHFVTFEVENVRADGADINNCFVGVVCDPDVGNEATDDMAGFDGTRDLGYAYDSDFSEQEFSGVPGFVGYDFLKSPNAEYAIDKNGDGAINTTGVDINGTTVYDVAAGDEIGLHAYKIFGRLAGDPQTEWEKYMVCAGHNFREDQPQVYQPFDLSNTPEDQRFLQTTGPFTLKAGEPVEIVVAMMVAASAGNAGDPITTRVANLQQVSDIAQGIFDNNFLLPKPPVAPEVTVRPGDRKAFITWNETAETTADEFYSITSDPNSSLYDPTFREYDFEGYRVWRSETGRATDWEMIAEYDVSSSTPRTVAISVDGGAYGGEVTFDRATTEGYFLNYGGEELWSNHEYLVQITDAGKMRVFDVNLGGLEIPCANWNDVPHGDYWYEHGDLPAKFELFDENLNYYSADSTRTADGNFDDYVPGMVMYIGGMALQFPNVPAPASQVVFRVIPSDTEVFGNEAGLAHAYIDSPLVNGRTYYYAVTAFDFQLSSPQSLESGKSLSQASVVPRAEPTGTTVPSIGTVAHTAGNSDGACEVTVVDPAAITGHTYQVGFNADQTWFVKDVTTNTIVRDNIANQAGGTDYPVVDGMLVRVVGPDPGIASDVYGPGTDWIGSPWTGNDLIFGSAWTSSIQPGEHVAVEVRFSSTNTQAAAVYRRDDGYSFLGQGTFPGTVWDMTNNRQLAVAFVENDFVITDGKPASVNTVDNYWMPSSSTGELGNREYLLITNLDYQATVTSDPWSQWAPYPGPFPAMYTSLPLARTNAEGATLSFTEGDVWAITPFFINTTADVFQWETTDRHAVTDAETGDSEIMVVPNPFIVRHELMANEDNPSLMFTNVPSQCVIRIYTLAGELVDVIEHNPGLGSAASGTAVWDMRNNDFQRITSGLYLFHVDDLNGNTTVGKFAVVR